MTPLEIGLGLAALAFGVAGSVGWGLYLGERRAREAAETWFTHGRSEPYRATIRDPGSAEERALEEAEDYGTKQAVTRLQRWITDEHPGVSEERAREEAEELLGRGIGALSGS